MAMTLEQSTQYAESLARSIWEKHYRTEAPDWEPMSGDLYGLLSQIDNMVTGISHLSAQARVRVTDSREAFEQAHGKVYGPYPPDNLPDGRWRLWQEAIDFATRLSQGAQGEALPEFLKDPVNVHALMLRGAIAVPSIRSMVDLRGEVPNDEDAQLARIAELQEQIAERAAVPDEMPDMRSFITDSYVGDTSVLETACWNEGWNAYREAMLAKAKLPAHFQPPEGARVVDAVSPSMLSADACSLSLAKAMSVDQATKVLDRMRTESWDSLQDAWQVIREQLAAPTLAGKEGA